MVIWVDDTRPAPNGCVWCKSVDEVKKILCDSHVSSCYNIELIDLDHDAGEFAKYGGDYIELLNWFEETSRSYPIRIHSMNPVGVENMRRIIRTR